MLPRPRFGQGLREQAVERLAVARSPCNLVRWRSPSVVFFFPQVLPPETPSACLASSSPACANLPGSKRTTTEPPSIDSDSILYYFAIF